MTVEIGAEAAQFPEKEYINGIAVAVQGRDLKVHKIEIFFGSEFEFYTISLLVMLKY